MDIATNGARRMLWTETLLWMMVLVLVATSKLASASSSSSSTTAAATPASTSTYESIRSLDRSGQALQLKHAQAAADQKGRLIMAFCVRQQQAAATGDESMEAPPLSSAETAVGEQNVVYILSPSSSASGGGGGSSDKGSELTAPRHHHHHRPTERTHVLAHPISGGTTTTSTSYLVCTGVQADAVWLIRQMQLYGKVVQQRYGSPGSSSSGVMIGAVATATAALVRALFWGYEASSSGDDNNGGESSSDAWQSSIQTVWKGQERWGRPVGVRTLVVSPTSSRTKSPHPQGHHGAPTFSLQIVEPSGVILDRPVFCCMGQQSDVLETKLEQLLLDGQGQEQQQDKNKKQNGGPRSTTRFLREQDVQGLVRQALAATMVTPPSELLVEVISGQGIQRKYWSL